MEVNLKVRLTKDLLFWEDITFDVSQTDVVDFVSIFNKSLNQDYINLYLSNFTCTVSAIKTTDLTKFEYFKGIKYTGLMKSKLISIIDITVDTHLTGLNIEKPDFNYAFILRAAEDQLSKIPRKPEIEFLIIKNANTGTETITVRKVDQLEKLMIHSDELIESNIFHPTIIPKYRLYVDNKIFAERVFPHGDVEINESAYLNLKPGRYELRVESLSKQKILIRHIKINKQIIDVKGDKCSFDIS